MIGSEFFYFLLVGPGEEVVCFLSVEILSWEGSLFEYVGCWFSIFTDFAECGLVGSVLCLVDLLWPDFGQLLHALCTTLTTLLIYYPINLICLITLIIDQLPFTIWFNHLHNPLPLTLTPSMCSNTVGRSEPLIHGGWPPWTCGRGMSHWVIIRLNKSRVILILTSEITCKSINHLPCILGLNIKWIKLSRFEGFKFNKLLWLVNSYFGLSLWGYLLWVICTNYLLPLRIRGCQSFYQLFLLCILLSCRGFLNGCSPSLSTTRSIRGWISQWSEKHSLVAGSREVGCLESTWVMGDIKVSALSIWDIFETCGLFSRGWVYLILGLIVVHSTLLCHSGFLIAETSIVL